MQKPSVKTSGGWPGAAPRPCSRRYPTPAAMSAAIPPQVVADACGMCSKASPRSSSGAVRPNQSMASASIPCSANRRASSS